MSFPCVVTAEQHTEKLIFELCEPVNVILAPATDARSGARPPPGHSSPKWRPAALEAVRNDSPSDHASSVRPRGSNRSSGPLPKKEFVSPCKTWTGAAVQPRVGARPPSRCRTSWGVSILMQARPSKMMPGLQNAPKAHPTTSNYLELPQTT